MSKKILPTNGPLRVCSRNPRYFTDNSGKVIYLTGSHTWYNLQDGGLVGASIPAFDYKDFLDMLQENNHNFFRLWHFEGWCAEAVTTCFAPMQYKRTGPGNAKDGGLKYDLNVSCYPNEDNFNQEYFDRMRSRISAARDRGIYVSVMLFQGWSLEQYATDPWAGHPFNPENNTDEIEGRRYLCHTLPGTSDENGLNILAIQRAYVRKVIDTVNDLDNVLYEISNEDFGACMEWQCAMVEYIKAYEAGKPEQHPVGMTAGDVGRGANNTQLFDSPADWISTGYYDMPELQNDPPAATGSKVIIADTDHIWGIGGDDAWVWKSFLRGLNPIFMDPMDKDKLESIALISAKYEDIVTARPAMGDTRVYAGKVNLIGMTPQSRLSSTNYCLAQAGSEYLVLQPDGDKAFTVYLQAGTYSVEWWSLESRTAAADADVASEGGAGLFVPRFSGKAVLYLKVRS